MDRTGQEADEHVQRAAQDREERQALRYWRLAAHVRIRGPQRGGRQEARAENR